MKGLTNCGEMSLAEEAMAEAVTDGMASDTTSHTVISTLLDRSDFFWARAAIEGTIPWSLKSARGHPTSIWTCANGDYQPADTGEAAGAYFSQGWARCPR